MSSLHITAENWETVSRLLDEAFELTAAQRAAWLVALDPRYEGVQPILERLLHAEALAETEDFLEALPQYDQDTRHLVSDRSDGGGFVEGAEVGPYQLRREIGRGGMGAVWLAERTDGSLKRPVALKLLRPGFHDRQFAERFGRERDILAGLTHPNIARLYDAGITADGQPFLALEYVEGATLTTYCDRYALDLRQRIDLFVQVLDAVQYAHRNLVVHRDLKPSNILVNNEGQVRLLDFGIAKLLVAGQRETNETELTRLGGRAHTPDYASPEQVAGTPITTGSDIYSLGVVLYELFCGKRPYKLPRETSAALEEAILSADPAPPSRVIGDDGAASSRGTTHKGLIRKLKGDLDTIVLKALKKNPAERYATADALAQDLRHYLNNEPVDAQPDSIVYRSAKFVRRHRLVVSAASIAALALLAGVVGTAWQAVEAQHQRNLALRQLERAEATNSFISFLLSEVSPDGQPFTSTDLMQRGDQWVDRLFAAKPELHAEMLVVLAERFGAAGDLKRELATLKRAHELAQKEADLDLRARIGCRYGAVWFIHGNGGEAAQREIDEALIRLQRVASERSAYVSCLMNTSVNARFRNENDKAVEIAERALAIVDGMPTPSAELQRRALETLASAYTFSGRFGAADGLYEKMLEAMRTSGLENSMEMGTVTANAGINLHGAGALRRALARHEESLKIFAQGHPDGRITPFMAQVHAGLNHFTGRTETALEWLQKAIASARDSGSDRVLGIVIAGAASIYLDLNDLAQAEAALSEAEPLLEKSTQPSHSSRVGLLVSRARIALARGNPGDAKKLLQQAIGTIQPVTPWHPTLASTYSRLALINVQLGDLDEAAQNADAAEKVARRLMGDLPSSYFLGQALSAQGAVLRARGDEQGAAEAYRAALAQLEDALGLEAPLTRLAREQLVRVPSK